jgi:pimeloyl-ACP methyl ester carboxylesterase
VTEYRLYGNPPYQVIVVHGGPGAPGEVAPVARELGRRFGVLEPLQGQPTIARQVEELASIIRQHATLPVTLIGHSWGAWLSLLLAAQHPQLVYKLILVSCGSLEAGYSYDINATRLQRLNDAERGQLQAVYRCLEDEHCPEASEAFASFGTLMSKLDSYDPIDVGDDDTLEYQYDIYRTVWPEAMALRESGELLRRVAKVKCPVVAMHGDYDPHPAAGVQEPLQRVLKHFRFIPLASCGHYPWRERQAREVFYRILSEELNRSESNDSSL